MPTFKDWNTRVDAIHKVVKDCLSPEMTVRFLVPSGKEGSLTFDNRDVVITIDGRMTHLNSARLVYTAYSKQLEEATAVAKQSADELLKASDQVLLALTEKAVPEMVMNRMAGNGTASEPRAFLKASVEKKGKDLIDAIGRKFPSWCASIDVEIMPDVKLNKTTNSYRTSYSLYWKNCFFNDAGASEMSPMDCLAFLNVFPDIQKKCLDFCDVFANTRLVTNW
jgi:hypothetical protein